MNLKNKLGKSYIGITDEDWEQILKDLEEGKKKMKLGVVSESFFDREFDEILKDANEVYQGHKPKKGDSWKVCDIQFLRNKLSEETVEALKEGGNEETIKEYAEVLDIINVALMLAKRLKGNER